MASSDSAPVAKPTFRDVWAHRRVIGWCLLIYLLPINFGYELSVIGNILAVKSFLRRYGVEADGTLEIPTRDQQILNAASTIGLFVSAFLTGYLSDIFGRKKVVILACLICFAGIMVQYFSNTILVLFGGKLIGTFGFGLGHSLGPVFVAEIAPPAFRGALLTLVNTMIVVGQWSCSLGVDAASYRDDDSAWRIPLLTQLIPPGVLILIGWPFLPESPTWLILHGKREQARRSLLAFNGADFDAEEALVAIELAIEKENKLKEEPARWVECFRGPNGRRTLIVCMVYIAQQFVGVNFIAGYLAYYFTLAGVNNALGVAQAAYAIQLFGNICSWPLVDRLGRRPLIVYSTILMTATLLLIGGISTIGTQTSLKATVALMTLWGFIYQASLGPAAYAVGGETPSPRLRQKTYSINIMTATAVSCAVLQIMPILLNTSGADLGGKITFVFFGPSLLMCIYLFFCFPEMKGRTYLELEEMFQARLPARKFRTHRSDAGLLVQKAMEATAGHVGKDGVGLEQVEVRPESSIDQKV